MITITIDVEFYDRARDTRHFTTVVGSVDDVHKALMDCVNFVVSLGWVYCKHTITVHGKNDCDEGE